MKTLVVVVALLGATVVGSGLVLQDRADNLRDQVDNACQTNPQAC